MKSSSKSINTILALLFLLSAAHIPASQAKEIEEVFKQMSEIEEPFKLRDPFQPVKFKKEKTRESNTPIRNGVFTNVPEIGQASLDKIKITGVLVGPERRAFLQVEGQDMTFTVKEGMTLGANDAEVKAILPGGIILVEKVTNIYGEIEYLETVIPISK